MRASNAGQAIAQIGAKFESVCAVIAGHELHKNRRFRQRDRHDTRDTEDSRSVQETSDVASKVAIRNHGFFHEVHEGHDFSQLITMNSDLVRREFAHL